MQVWVLDLGDGSPPTAFYADCDALARAHEDIDLQFYGPWLPDGDKASRCREATIWRLELEGQPPHLRGRVGRVAPVTATTEELEVMHSAAAAAGDVECVARIGGILDERSRARG